MDIRINGTHQELAELADKLCPTEYRQDLQNWLSKNMSTKSFITNEVVLTIDSHSTMFGANVTPDEFIQFLEKQLQFDLRRFIASVVLYHTMIKNSKLIKA